MARGAAGEVKLAIDPALDGVTGRYFDETEESNASAAAQDRTLQQRVYEVMPAANRREAGVTSL